MSAFTKNSAKFPGIASVYTSVQMFLADKACFAGSVDVGSGDTVLATADCKCAGFAEILNLELL